MGPFLRVFLPSLGSNFEIKITRILQFKEKSVCALYSRTLNCFIIVNTLFLLFSLKIAFARWRTYKFCFNQLMCHYAD